MTATASFPYLQPTHALNDLPGLVKALDEDGYALIPNVLSPDEVVATKAAIDRCRHFGFDGRERNDHYKCVFNRERIFLSYADRTGVIDLAEALMGDQCHLIGMSAWRDPPGRPSWWVHTDQLFVEF